VGAAGLALPNVSNNVPALAMVVARPHVCISVMALVMAVAKTIVTKDQINGSTGKT